MSKLAFNIFLVFCGFLVIVAGLGVTMMIAPGADILGLRYIRSTSGSYYEKQTVYCAESSVQEFNITCDNIPINVVFAQSYTFSVVLDEQFNGYTKTIDNPDLAVENAGNKVNFSVREYVPFLYHNRIDGSALTISIPIYYRGVVAIQSRDSNITIDGLNGMLSNLIVTTGGKVNVNDVTLSKLHLNIGSKDAYINTGAKINDLHIEAINAQINITDKIDGKITYKAKGGGLYFNACEQLEVDAKSARIASSNEELAKVNGDAKINTNAKIMLDVYGNTEIITKSGDITLGAETIVYGGEVNLTTKSGDVILNGRRMAIGTIKTKSGDIWAENVSDCNIETSYGFIDVQSCTNLSIVGGSGNVFVKDSNGDVSVSTRSGDVVIGDKEKSLNAKIDVKTLGGNIRLINISSGVCSTTTKSGNVNFIGDINNNAKIVVVSDKGDVWAENMSGKIEVETNGSVTLKMLSLASGIEIIGKDKPVTIETANNNLTFDLTTTKTNNIIVFGDVIKDQYYLTSIDANIAIITNKGTITICEKIVEAE